MAKKKIVSKEQIHLEGEREQVTSELNNLRSAMLNEVDTEPDEGDAEIFEREKTAALIAVLERRIQDIEHALRAIEKGQYGICERCGNPIEPERLEVKPDAILCLNCQREVEAINKRNRGRAPIRW
ncbi:MAG: TraR/DksA C4-type zinc finger protein [Caldilineaceae bacterium]|nr:TraR/DksA C4-type zinc finger protein [Caldilineaceae bacterium]HRJ44076.1 TraR/DksA C4-type zinc finger protein [Caldilineaceae bacterium]